jgi:hypothetical protein
MAFLAVAIAGYAFSFTWRGIDAFSTDLLASFDRRPWATWAHIVFGGTALLTGALNFRHAIRRARPALHHRVGEAYVLSALGTGLAGGWLAIFAYGGPANRLGFGGLALATLFTTSAAWRYATQRDFRRHRQWMVRSFAMILAAVSLRIQVPLLAMWLKGFDPAYAIVAWSCWVPNLLVAEWIARTTKHPA